MDFLRATEPRRFQQDHVASHEKNPVQIGDDLANSEFVKETERPSRRTTWIALDRRVDVGRAFGVRSASPMLSDMSCSENPQEGENGSI